MVSTTKLLRENPIDYGREPTLQSSSGKHMRFMRYVYPMYPYLMVGVPALVTFGLTRLLLPFVLSILITLVVATAATVRVVKFLRQVLERERGYEWKFPSVKYAKVYKDITLIKGLWSYSPYRTALLESGVQRATDASEKQFLRQEKEKIPSFQQDSSVDLLPRLDDKRITAMCDNQAPVIPYDKPDSVIFSQPVEGYCGDASINTVLRSFVGVKLQPIPSVVRPMSLQVLKSRLETEVLESLKPNAPFRAARHFHVDPREMSFKRFVELLSLANKPGHRVLVNFLRSAGFAERPPFLPPSRALALMGGHWSPVASVGRLPHSSDANRTGHDADDDGIVALVLDVNDSYGPFVISAYRLYLTCATMDGKTYRGLIILDV